MVRIDFPSKGLRPVSLGRKGSLITHGLWLQRGFEMINMGVITSRGAVSRSALLCIPPDRRTLMSLSAALAKEADACPPDKSAPTMSRWLELSTGHVTRRDMEQLAEGAQPEVVRSIPYAEGAFLVLMCIEEGDDVREMCRQDDMSESFAKVVEYARGLGCDGIRLDCDGPHLEDAGLDLHAW